MSSRPPTHSKSNRPHVRYLACQAILPIVNPDAKGRSLDDAMAPALATLSKTEDQALLKSLCYNLCRQHTYLTALSQPLLKKPFKTKDLDLQLALNIGMLQLFFMETASHAAIKESVEIAKIINKPWATALLNGILRNAQRQGLATLEQQLVDPTLSILTSHPQWLVDRIQNDWPDQAQSILTANNQPGPLTLRINTQKISREAYLAELSRHSLEADPTRYSPYGVTLKQPLHAAAIPLFNEGIVSIQDEAAQLAADLLAPQPNEHILDACAAPGSKSTHLLERMPNCQLTANDISAARMAKVVDNFKRLGITATTTTSDLHTLAQQATERFDAILLDGPCSGTGVIRRHPDIKWLRRESDLTALTATQAALLASAWQILKPGGRLLYCTCSILHEENESIIESFLQQTPTARAAPLKIAAGCNAQNGHYLLPSEKGHDGFYFCLLQKVSTQ